MDIKDSGLGSAARSACYAAACFKFAELRAKGRDAVAEASGCGARTLGEIGGALDGWNRPADTERSVLEDVREHLRAAAGGNPAPGAGETAALLSRVEAVLDGARRPPAAVPPVAPRAAR